MVVQRSFIKEDSFVYRLYLDRNINGNEDDKLNVGWQLLSLV